MQHQIEGLDTLTGKDKIKVLASLLKDAIKEEYTVYFKHNNPCHIRVFFFDELFHEAVYGLYTGSESNRISILSEHFKTEN